MAAKPADHPIVQVFDEIRRIDHGVRAALTESLPPGLSFAQYEVLGFLQRHGEGQTPAEIARGVQAAKSGLTNTLQRLEGGGLAAADGVGPGGALRSDRPRVRGRCRAIGDVGERKDDR